MQSKHRWAVVCISHACICMTKFWMCEFWDGCPVHWACTVYVQAVYECRVCCRCALHLCIVCVRVCCACVWLQCVYTLRLCSVQQHVRCVIWCVQKGVDNTSVCVCVYTAVCSQAIPVVDCLVCTVVCVLPCVYCHACTAMRVLPGAVLWQL
jgi:hypothetical protein